MVLVRSFADAVGWLRERDVLLPGVTSAGRAGAREGGERLWETPARDSSSNPADRHDREHPGAPLPAERIPKPPTMSSTNDALPRPGSSSSQPENGDKRVRRTLASARGSRREFNPAPRARSRSEGAARSRSTQTSVTVKVVLGLGGDVRPLRLVLGQPAGGVIGLPGGLEPRPSADRPEARVARERRCRSAGEAICDTSANARPTRRDRPWYAARQERQATVSATRLADPGPVDSAALT